ncbi:serpentine type 7TM GPCR chemoreceptor srbc domain-containing protein [Ditylenchus destructor]|uniref:Serpentine type 7TM GPCR chemoreceptor srbc domain-containing protein n=1 Tax=Ditylenchus destructor TaxID=166010 RepID=A0AAD4R5N5_9BILA|nr:serpentine type 7TM GPCR chemoreceptor srbc domain-containing protein [Ditylenchus destructor]
MSIILVEYIYIFLCCLFSVIITANAMRMLKRLKVQQNFDASPCLIVYLGALILSCATLGAHSVVVIVMIASGNTETLDTKEIFWTGLFSGSLIPAAPIGVFFLTLDRLFIITLPAIYTKKMTKISIALSSLFTICALFTMNLTINVIERPTAQVSGCYSFGCITSEGSRFIYAVDRLGVALPNFTSGVIFVVVLFTFRRKLQASSGSYVANNHSKRTGDRLALYVVLFEVFLDLLPNMINFFLTTLYGINISRYVGAFRSVTYCTNAFCCVLTHTRVLRRIFGASKELRRLPRQTQLAPGGHSGSVTRPRQAHADQSQIISRLFAKRMVSVQVKSYFIDRFALIRGKKKTSVIQVRSNN